MEEIKNSDLELKREKMEIVGSIQYVEWLIKYLNRKSAKNLNGYFSLDIGKEVIFFATDEDKEKIKSLHLFYAMVDRYAAKGYLNPVRVSSSLKYYLSYRGYNIELGNSLDKMIFASLVNKIPHEADLIDVSMLLKDEYPEYSLRRQKSVYQFINKGGKLIKDALNSGVSEENIRKTIELMLK